MLLSNFRLPLLAAAGLFLVTGHARDAYITDSFEITLRSGPSTTNSIHAMLGSGQKVEVLEQDEQSGYTKVLTAQGREGYVLTRYLNNQPSGRQRATILERQAQQLQQQVDRLNAELENYQGSKQADNQRITELSEQLEQSRTDYEKLRSETRDTVAILENSRDQQARIQLLEQQLQDLKQENLKLTDSTEMDWFVRGAGVTLGAFLLGILVTRIRWKKRDSWSNY